MITDRIGRHKVLLPNINHNKICDIKVINYFLNLRVIFLLAQKPFLNAHTLSNHLGMTDTVLLHCPISAEIRTLDSQSDLRNFVIVMID